MVFPIFPFLNKLLISLVGFTGFISKFHMKILSCIRVYSYVAAPCVSELAQGLLSPIFLSFGRSKGSYSSSPRAGLHGVARNDRLIKGLRTNQRIG